MSNDTAEFLALLQEQNERMSQMTKTLLEMSELRTVECKDTIEIAPMIEEIFTDLAPLAEKKNIRLEYSGNGMMIGSDTLIYRLLFNLTENAIRYNRENASVIITVNEKNNQLYIRVKDNGYGIPEQYRLNRICFFLCYHRICSIFVALFSFYRTVVQKYNFPYK